MANKAVPPAPKSSEEAKAILAKERARLEAAQEQFDAMEETLAASFGKLLDEGMTDEEREAITLSDSIPEIASLVLDKYKTLVTEPVEVERAALEEAEERLKEKEFGVEVLSASEAFAEAHPDVDMEAFATFLQEELSPAQLRKLNEDAAGDMVKHHELAYGLFSGKGAADDGTPEDGETNSPDLDTDLSMIAGEAGDLDDEASADVEDDFMTQMGMDR